MDPSTTNQPDYSQYGVQDFVVDDYFRRWIFAPDSETEAFWNSFLLAHPRLQPTIDEATAFVLHLQTRFDELGENSEQRIWKTLEQRFDRLETPVRPTLPRPWFAYWPVAASVTALLLAGSYWYSQQPHRRTIRTAFSQTRSVQLPDSSIVLLNGNSSLTYVDRWPAGQPREVWLDGEGYFRVMKRSTPAGRLRFITHTSNLDITVLGTRFTVNTRRGATNVMLLEGKVTLTKPSQPALPAVLMKPGELATAIATTPRVQVRPEKSQSQVAWVAHRFVFENTPLGAIARQLADSEGVNLEFDDATLANRRFTANLASHNVETLIATLEATFDLVGERDGNRVILRHSSK